MKRWLLILTALLATFLTELRAEVVPASSCNYASLNVSDGLSQISVLKVYQDSKGFMWFATRNGLNRYDGIEFKVFRRDSDEPGGLSDNHTLCITEDKTGGIWAGTMNGLNRIDMSTGIISAYNAETGFPELDKTISALACDNAGRMLIGAQDGLYIHSGGENFTKISMAGRLDRKNIIGIEVLDDGNILLCTEGDGLYECEPDFCNFRHFCTRDGSLPSDTFSKIYKDSRGKIWLGGTTDGMLIFDPASGESRWFTKDNSGLATDNVRCFADDGSTMFIGTMEGIYITDLSGDGPIRFESNNLSNFSVYSIMLDRSGTRWVGTYSGGVNYYHPSLDRVSMLCPKAPEQDYPNIFGPMVSCGDRLYIATEGSGLLEYDTKRKESKYYHTTDPHFNHASNIIKCVASLNDTLYCGNATGEIFIFNTKNKRFSRYMNVSAASVYSVVADSDGSLWVGTSRDSLGLLKVKDGKVIANRFTKDGIYFPGTRIIAMMDEGSLLVGTRRHGLIKYDRQKDSISLAGGQAFQESYITSICRSGSSTVYYIGTYGDGLFRYDASTDKARRIRISGQVASTEISQIVQDTDGCLWVSTHRGIVRINPDTDEQTLIGRSSSVDVQEFSLHSGTLTPEGYVAFSGNNGFVIFHPQEVVINSFIPPLVFTGLSVNNEDRSEIGIDNLKEIPLRYDENNISISFAALNYISPKDNRYSYRLIGIDQDWVRASSRHNVHYVNLAPGKYRFEVKCANNDGIWNDEVRAIDINILPPIWKRWWAKVIYVLLILGTAVTVMYYIIYKNRLEQSLLFEQQKQHQAEEFHQSRLRMFTNLSHELRTPLLLIMSPLNELMKQFDLGAQAQNKIKLIQDNSQRLLTLVNQLMDLNKNEAGQLKIKVEKDDIAAFLKEIYLAFNQLAVPRGIDLVYSSGAESIPALIDKSAIEKVCFNLLSNAIKFTNPGGHVWMSVEEGTNSGAESTLGHSIKALRPDTPVIHLRIKDDGKGIPAEDLKDIFTAFYQVEDGKAKEVEGTGIGLSLTESIVQLHHGVIWAESAEGSGAEFNILLPNDIDAYKQEEIGSETPLQKVVDVIPPSEMCNVQPEGRRRYTVLLVEDNTDVRSYIRQYLEPYYFVLEAGNGKDALDIVLKKNPNIVVSDIMMPVRNGLELCADIKNNSKTAHIPVILMTARSLVVQIKEGFATGADDYIVKPFDMDLLLYRIRNILQSRDRLRNLYGKTLSPESMGIEIVSDNDRFTTKFFEVVEKNIDNPNLDVQMICSEIGLSRANLYRKLKAISDLSPMELVRNKRLEIAAKLLQESDYSVSEIANYTGFSSHPYFTSCFKNQYGQTPSEYIETHKSQKP